MTDEVIGNSEGSIFRGEDGNAYQVIKGRNVRVSNDKLHIEGYRAPSNVVINGRTYRNQNGKVYRVEGKKLIPITDQNELLNLDRQMNAGQKSGGSDKGNGSGIIIGGVALLILLLLSRK